MLSWVSINVIILYLFLTFCLSVIVSRRCSVSRDFSTGGRSFGWLTAGISILATYISAMTFIGLPGWVFHSGLSVMALHLNYPIVVFLAVIFFVPVFYKLKLTSIYEYVELRFGIYARTLNVLIFLFVQSISAGMILYAVALMLVQVLPLSISQAIVAISLFTLSYTCLGGIVTVIWTDILQSLVLFIGAIGLWMMLWKQMNLSSIPILLDMTIIKTQWNFQDDTTIWAGLFAVGLLHLSVYATNQLIIQRTLATKNVATAQKSMLVCGYGAFFIYLLFASLGVLLRLFYQQTDFQNSNEVMLDFIFHHTSPLMIGVMLSALIAAAMSTLDSTYHSMATVLTTDLYQRFMCKKADDLHYQRVARYMSLLTALLVMVPALLSISNASVLKNIASVTAIFVGIRLGTFVMGLFFAQANENGVMIGSFFSVVAILLARFIHIAWPWYAPIGLVVFLGFGVIGSMLSGRLSPSQQAFIQQQKALFVKPTQWHYGLLFFAGATLIFCYFLPDLVMVLIAK